MLPITNHRVHIPHSLAIGAAIVGLVVALGWEGPVRTNADTAPADPPMVTLEDDSGPALDPVRDREPSRGREMLPGFGPLVLPFSPGR